MVRFGFRLPAAAPAGVIAGSAAVVEAAGFECVWIPDSQMLWRDAWVVLAAVASATRASLGVAVTNPVTRHPTVTAAAAVTVDELSGGRVRLGISAGDSAVRSIDLRPARVDELRMAVERIRTLTAWRVSGTDGRGGSLAAAKGRSAPIPIYVGAGGPRMLELAGEVGDGAIILTGHDAGSLRYAARRLASGTARRSASRAALDMILAVRCYVGPDWRDARRRIRPIAAQYARKSPATLAAAGIAASPPDDDSYADLVHAEDPEDAALQAAWLPDRAAEQFAERHALIGDARMVIRELERIVEAGISEFLVVGLSSHGFETDLVETFRKRIIPHFTR